MNKINYFLMCLLEAKIPENWSFKADLEVVYFLLSQAPFKFSLISSFFRPNDFCLHLLLLVFSLWLYFALADFCSAAISVGDVVMIFPGISGFPVPACMFWCFLLSLVGFLMICFLEGICFIYYYWKGQ